MIPEMEGEGGYPIKNSGFPFQEFTQAEFLFLFALGFVSLPCCAVPPIFRSLIKISPQTFCNLLGEMPELPLSLRPLIFEKTTVEDDMNVLVLNAGSSSLKFQIIATDLDEIKNDKDDRILRGEVEDIGGEAIVKVQYRKDDARTMTAPLRDMAAALDYVLRYVASDRSGVSEIKSTADIHAVGHRVVHGGEAFKESTLIDERVLKGIEECIDLAPLHNPNNLKGISAARESFGSGVPQVAVLDT